LLKFLKGRAFPEEWECLYLKISKDRSGRTTLLYFTIA